MTMKISSPLFLALLAGAPLSVPRSTSPALVRGRRHFPRTGAGLLPECLSPWKTGTS